MTPREELDDKLTVERFTRHQRTTEWVPPKPPPEPLPAVDEVRAAAHRLLLKREAC
jgi:hypothetical protein